MMARATPQVGYDIPSTRVAVPSDVPDVIIQSLAAMATARLSPARVAVDVASVVLGELENKCNNRLKKELTTRKRLQSRFCGE